MQVSGRFSACYGKDRTGAGLCNATQPPTSFEWTVEDSASCKQPKVLHAERCPSVAQESDLEVEAKPEANGNGPWQGAVRPLDDYDEDDAVTSPQDNFPCPAPKDHSMSRLQQQSLPACQQTGPMRPGSPQVIAQQPPIGKNGSGSSNSGSNSPEIHAQAPIEQTAPPAITV